jgi:hypothetical protein
VLALGTKPLIFPRILLKISVNTLLIHSLWVICYLISSYDKYFPPTSADWGVLNSTTWGKVPGAIGDLI